MKNIFFIETQHKCCDTQKTLKNQLSDVHQVYGALRVFANMLETYRQLPDDTLEEIRLVAEVHDYKKILNRKIILIGYPVLNCRYFELDGYEFFNFSPFNK